jgi:cytochrome c peroxidase
MKTIALSLVALLLSLPLPSSAAGGPTLHVQLEPRFGNLPIALDSESYRTEAGEEISVSRLDMLLSGFVLRRRGAGWLGPAEWAAYASAGQNRTQFDVPGIARGRYDKLAFNIGVRPPVNRADPSTYGPEHPLNPNVNGLHWGWQGGYVFLALEGGWFPREQERRGYSYHLATDRQLMRIELPVDLTITNDVKIQLSFDLSQIFARPNPIRLEDGNITTHSREDDPLADQLRKNIEGAFRIVEVRSLPTFGGKLQPPVVALIGSNTTPYKLQFPPYVSAPRLPGDNPLTWEGIRLGALLFFDPRLSINNAQSCGSCHRSSAALTDGSRAVSRGAEGQIGTRNSMSLLNLAWKSSFFWDGRIASLRDQVLQPIQNPIEMHQSLDVSVAKIRASRVNSRHRGRAAEAIKFALGSTASQMAGARLTDESPSDYPALFERAFGTAAVNSDRVARALEQFLLIQVSFDSKFDRFVQGQERLTPEEQRGLKLFNTEYDPRRRQYGADCFHCHGGPLFQSQVFANNGLEVEFNDLGRYLATNREGDKGKFSVPSLRNIAVTSPYMHDGRFNTLEEVVAHYAQGVKRSPTLDPNLAKHPVGRVPLSVADRNALVAFLKTLSDKRFERTPDATE